MNLTNDQIDAVIRGEAVSVVVEDRDCVIVRADVFQRVKAELDDGLEAEQVGRLIDQNMKEHDEGDPLLDSYQRYRKPQSVVDWTRLYEGLTDVETEAIDLAIRTRANLTR